MAAEILLPEFLMEFSGNVFGVEVFEFGLWYSCEVPSGILVILNEKGFECYCHWMSLKRYVRSLLAQTL